MGAAHHPLPLLPRPPLPAAIASAVLFLVIRTCVLRRKNAAKLAFWVLPPAVIVTSFVCIYFVLTKVGGTDGAPVKPCLALLPATPSRFEAVC